MLRDRRVVHLLLASVALVSLVGATTPLKPLVVRNEQNFGPIPAECEQGISPAPVLRVDLSQVPLPPPPVPPENVPPPSGELRGALDAAQSALARNDRPAFDESLAAARTLLADYPAGAERRVAEDLVRVYDAASRLWDAQYQSPFFAEGSPEHQLVSGFPGYAEAVRRSIWTDGGGNRFYPAAESRDFLTRIAAERLQRLGINSTSRTMRTSRSASSGTSAPPSPRRRTTASEKPARSETSPRRTTPAARRSSTRHEAATPKRARVSTASSSSPSTSAKKPVAANPTPASPRSASPTATAVPAPAASLDPVATPPAAGGSLTSVAPPTETGVAMAPPPADTDVTASSPTDTAIAGDTALTGRDTAMETTSATETSSTEEVPAVPATRERSVVLPAILILIGLGVLIVLFRASK